MEMNNYIDIKYKTNKSGETTIKIIDKKTKKVLMDWDDSANCYYPEDLVWDRDIGKLFSDAFEIGFKYGKEQKEVIK